MIPNKKGSILYRKYLVYSGGWNLSHNLCDLCKFVWAEEDEKDEEEYEDNRHKEEKFN